jgi:predicted phosphodiesterase
LSGLLLCLFLGSGQAAAAKGQHLKNQSAEALKGLSVPFKFAVIGDTKKGDKGNNIYKYFAKTIADDKPAFVVNTGDVITDQGDQEEWNAFVGLSKPITMPYFIAPGNHEIKDEKTEGIFRSNVTQPGNRLYFSFVAGDSLFIILDTERPGAVSKIEDGQLDWLTKTLADSKEHFKFVFMHRPMYPSKEAGMRYIDSLGRYPRERDSLQAIFEKYGVTAVFAGHEHLYLKETVGSVCHIICGGGGARLYAPEDKGGFHFYIRGMVDKSSASFDVIDDKGHIRDTFKLQPTTH